MKIKLESQKTIVRVNKEELRTLLDCGELVENTIFPDGRRLDFQVKLELEPYLNFDGDKIFIALPRQLIRTHKPSKKGISFRFLINKDDKHHLLFEVDIKKPPLSAKH